jgi:uncharacterized protein (DUF4415 family)
MAKKDRIVRYSAEQLATMPSETNWAKVKTMSQPDVERMADEDEGPLLDSWEKTIIVGVPEPKKDVHIRLEPAVLRWFKSHGPGYQTRINTVQRSFVQAREREEPAPKQRAGQAR